ncbi:hypothetical protein O181_040096 [Austropuccinia psidii MF-1]|uniref:Uncharacterized protein n=1 Tax=Austropuccinia psidii MF-1 TaxID=1389203 RepID=A0A9Q3HD32_9BASI|nr:hypothetical protein [Austropuccinia psidii MF-1]
MSQPWERNPQLVFYGSFLPEPIYGQLGPGGPKCCLATPTFPGKILHQMASDTISITPFPQTISLIFGLGSFQHSRGLWPLQLYPGTRGQNFGPPGTILVHQFQRTKMSQNLKDGIFSHGPTRIKAWPVAATRGHKPPSEGFTLKIREALPPPCAQSFRGQEWGIYGIIYHYAEFFP